MSRRLYLVRHAKSSWKQVELDDHDRPLSGRGRRASDLLARHLREQGIVPALVLCSTSRRTRETLERIAPALPRRTRVLYEEELYGASATTLLGRLRGVPDEVASVMLIGHNPAVEDLALELARPSAERHELAVKFPTGALATLSVPGGSWRALDHGAAELVAFVRPRELER